MLNFNKENMIKWAEALESGKYKQIHGSWGQHTYDDGEIINEGKFCCLNVALMELTGKDYGQISNRNRYTSSEVFQDNFHPNWSEKSLNVIFYKMNDDQKLSFPEIAAEIRKMVEND